jgi:hypothetical protein
MMATTPCCASFSVLDADIRIALSVLDADIRIALHVAVAHDEPGAAERLASRSALTTSLNAGAAASGE